MRKILLALTVLGVATVSFIYRAELFLSIQRLEFISASNPLATAFILIFLKMITAPIGFPGTPLTLLSGSLLGTFFGTIVALIGNTLGATLAFLLSRYVLRDYVQQKIGSAYPRLKKYEQKLEQRALGTVIVLRLIPLFPFNALNFLLGVTTLPLREYVIGSFVGMIPGTFLFVYFGESLRMLSVFNVILAIIGIVVLIYLGKMYEKRP